MKPLHRQGAYQRLARMVVQFAWANPSCRCWRCGRTIAEHEPHKDGKRAVWTAGHTIDGSPNARPWLDLRTPPPGDWLAPEASTCNFAHAREHSARLRGSTRRW